MHIFNTKKYFKLQSLKKELALKYNLKISLISLTFNVGASFAQKSKKLTNNNDKKVFVLAENDIKNSLN